MRRHGLAVFSIARLTEADERHFRQSSGVAGAFSWLKIAPPSGAGGAVIQDPVQIATEGVTPSGAASTRTAFCGTPWCSATMPAVHRPARAKGLCVEWLVHKLDTYHLHRVAQQKVEADLGLLRRLWVTYRANPAKAAVWVLRARSIASSAAALGSTYSGSAVGSVACHGLELLMVLERPEIPLHTNGSENDICRCVTRCKVSEDCSDDGRDCRDAFLGIAKTCTKLGVAFWTTPAAAQRSRPASRSASTGPRPMPWPADLDIGCPGFCWCYGFLPGGKLARRRSIVKDAVAHCILTEMHAQFAARRQFHRLWVVGGIGLQIRGYWCCYQWPWPVQRPQAGIAACGGAALSGDLTGRCGLFGARGGSGSKASDDSITALVMHGALRGVRLR